MVWGIDELLADITRHITLRAGDVVLTGTPWHSRPVFPGDIVEVEVEGIGRLLNVVVEAPAPHAGRGFPGATSKSSLGVALGSDYRVLKQANQSPSAEAYRAARGDLIARNMASGPPPKERSMTVTKRAVPRAEQVGSLKRSPRLIAANEALYAPGHVAVEAIERARGMGELYAIAGEESRRVVQRQIDIGLDVVSDGEFRRYMFLNSLFDGITGFSSEVSKAKFKAADGSVIEWNMQYVVDRLKQVDSPAAREAAFMSTLTDHLYKVTFPAGSFLALPYNHKAEINGHAYASHRALIEDVVAIEKRMIADVVAAGCRYVQLDFPVYPFLCDPDWRARMDRHGYDWQETLDLAMWADWEVIAGLPRDVRTAIHVCRGNNQARYVAEGALDPVAEALFSLPVRLIPHRVGGQGAHGRLLGAASPAGRRVGGGARHRELQASHPGGAGRAAAGARSGGRLRRSAQAGPLAAMRLRVHPQGQPSDGGRPVAEARAGRGHGAALLGVIRRPLGQAGATRATLGSLALRGTLT